MKKISIGADIGGSHITCRLYNLESKHFVNNQSIRMPVNSNSSKEEILSAWAAAIIETAKGYILNELRGIGFAMPGPFDYQNGIAWFKGVQKFDSLYGVNIRKELLTLLNLPETFPVKFQNDAACFAIGESFSEQAIEFERVLAITLGTGFGTTFIHKHLPVAGKDGVPDDGFLYHIPVGNSIADDYFSTRWFLNEYYTITGQTIGGVKNLAEITESESIVKEIFATFGRNLGAFLAPFLKNFNAGCLVLGGNISASFTLFENELKNELKKAGSNAQVFVSALQEDAALIGSASLCNEDFYTNTN